MPQNLPIPLREGAEQHASEQTAQMRAWLVGEGNPGAEERQ
jgi:hypothetical protein